MGRSSPAEPLTALPQAAPGGPLFQGSNLGLTHWASSGEVTAPNCHSDFHQEKWLQSFQRLKLSQRGGLGKQGWGRQSREAWSALERAKWAIPLGCQELGAHEEEGVCRRTPNSRQGSERKPTGVLCSLFVP